ncbi:MAG: class I tRNA ligase family protein, partial [Burkholderiales bacterium]
VRLQEEVAADYARYQFHLVAQKLQGFCAEDLGAFYLDILKDRLYTCAARSVARRSAQTALWHVTNALARLMAPILSFTAEELWQVLTRDTDDSVFLHTLHELPPVEGAPALLARWDRLRLLRAPVLKRIEDLRAAGKVGSSLQAEADLHVNGADHELLASLGEDLRFMLLTSAARVHRGGDGELRVEVAPSANAKCDRCWHYRPDVNGAGLCARCEINLHGSGESRRHA